MRAAIVLAAAAAALSAPSLGAQTHKVAAPEKVTRAVGVYEWTGDLLKPNAARLVPVSLFLDGRLQDAGVYLARPVPFALQTGVVYSVEKAGAPVGTLDLELARNVVSRRSATDDSPVSAWFGYGRFAPPAPEKKAAPLKASATVPAIVSSADPDRPHFDPHPEKPAGDADAKQDSKSGREPSKTAEDMPAAPVDPDRPTLRRHSAAADKKQTKESGSGVTGPETSLNADPSRPTMRRGKPAGETAVPQLSGIPAALHQMVAVSDAGNRDTHVFAREWESPAERAATLSAFETLARGRLTGYMAANGLRAVGTGASSSPAASAPGKTGPAKAAPARTTSGAPRGSTRKTNAAATTAVALSNEEVAAYTLSYGGLPAFVYTAEVEVAVGGPVYLTMIAQRLPSGELQPALTSVTDAGHLDRTPWMRLVDAVDADGSHRGSLLFELRAQSARQFALYRVVSAEAEQMFVSGLVQ